MARGSVQRPADRHRRRVRLRPVGSHGLPRRLARVLQRSAASSSARRAASTCPASSTSRRARAEPGWRVATTLPRDGAAPWGFGRYRAADYDELIDHPVEIADFAHVAFEAGGATHDVVIAAGTTPTCARLAGDLARICRWQIDLFGGGRTAAPRSTATCSSSRPWATATAGSSIARARRSSPRAPRLPRPGLGAVDDDYRGFLGLASHEYFHAWNVKRIKPAAFLPYDLAREGYTRQLWAFEGFTSLLRRPRAGAQRRHRRGELARARSAARSPPCCAPPAGTLQSVAESSFDAWIKYYRQDENTPNAVVSYYTKGALVGLALDLTLRAAGSSLDALMRALWQRHGRHRHRRPGGRDRAPRQRARRTRPVGVLRALRRRPRGSAARRAAGLDGHRVCDARGQRPARPRRHARTQARGRRPPRAHRSASSSRPAAKRSSSSCSATARRSARAWPAGDTIIAADGLRVNAESLDAAVGRRAPGEAMVLHRVPARRADDVRRHARGRAARHLLARARRARPPRGGGATRGVARERVGGVSDLLSRLNVRSKNATTSSGPSLAEVR